jgi:hypothetical protein
VLSVGKLNVAKIANFTQDIEVFVNVSCPFGILMQDKGETKLKSWKNRSFSNFVHLFSVHEHHRPIVSVFEAYAALDPAQKWMADRPYIFECTDVLASIPSTSLGWVFFVFKANFCCIFQPMMGKRALICRWSVDVSTQQRRIHKVNRISHTHKCNYTVPVRRLHVFTQF